MPYYSGMNTIDALGGAIGKPYDQLTRFGQCRRLFPDLSISEVSKHYCKPSKLCYRTEKLRDKYCGVKISTKQGKTSTKRGKSEYNKFVSNFLEDWKRKNMNSYESHTPQERIAMAAEEWSKNKIVLPPSTLPRGLKQLELLEKRELAAKNLPAKNLPAQFKSKGSKIKSKGSKIRNPSEVDLNEYNFEMREDEIGDIIHELKQLKAEEAEIIGLIQQLIKSNNLLTSNARANEGQYNNLSRMVHAMNATQNKHYADYMKLSTDLAAVQQSIDEIEQKLKIQSSFDDAIKQAIEQELEGEDLQKITDQIAKDHYNEELQKITDQIAKDYYDDLNEEDDLSSLEGEGFNWKRRIMPSRPFNQYR